MKINTEDENILRLKHTPEEVKAFIADQMKLHEEYMNSPDNDDAPGGFENKAVREFMGEEFWKATKLPQFDYSCEIDSDVQCRAFLWYKDIFRANLRCMLEENEMLTQHTMVTDRMKYLSGDAAQIRWLQYLIDEGISQEEFKRNFALNAYYDYYSNYYASVTLTDVPRDMVRRREMYGEIPSEDRVRYSNMVKYSVMEYINEQYVYNRFVGAGAKLNLPSI
ncbi:hypothetical protein [Ruminococcus albus]|uniref:Uncharacterized protein n=1 Tax=Ruminococcus albus TaxID=1264 RepID=A0A1I1RUX5_RUMAL|nr:hypothetical protein [Ruminococcus albus]SFD38051.1 hypothetical protein SAMN02910406_03779 [Ruminococcus albus]